MADNKDLNASNGEKAPLDESRPDADESQPKDGLRLVYLVFILHGIGILLPWNSFINAKDYFLEYKLSTTESIKPDYTVNFMNYIGLAAQLPNLLLSAFNVFFQSTRPAVQTGSSIHKLMFVIAIEIVVCVFTCSLAIVDSSDWPRLFFDFTILSVVVLNCCTGVYQSSAFGMAALLPMSYSNAIVLGNNICGTLIAMANILCKLASAQNLQLTAVMYFTFSTLLLALCFGSLIVLPKMRFYQHHQNKMVEIPMMEAHFKAIPTADETDGDNTDAPLQTTQTTLPLDTSCGNTTDQVLVVPAAATNGHQRVWTQYADTAKECCPCFSGPNSMQIARRYWLRYWLALKDGWVHCLSIWSIFFCTLSCFPAVQSNVMPVDLPKAWFADVYVFLFFNLFAMVGNIVSNFIQCPSPKWLAPVVWLRTLFFIPFFIMCNSEKRSPYFPVIIRSDAAFILGMIAFGFTSGYFSSLCMMYAPRCVKRQEHASLVAMLASFFLVLGVFCGISFGTLLTNIIQFGWIAPASNSTFNLGFNNSAYNFGVVEN